MMKRSVMALVGSVALFGATPIAQADILKFDPGLYGKAHLPLSQSTGNAGAYIAQQKGAFEPIHELPGSDPKRVVSRAIGRLDIVYQGRDGKRYLANCTGSLLPDNYVLTNYHCIPAKGGDRPVKASILMDYLVQDGKGSKRFELSVTPVDSDKDLDFSIVKVKGNPVREFGYIKFSWRPVKPGQSLIVIHHPLGRPKMMTRFRCLSVKKQGKKSELRHRCDTQPGSSGSLLFDAKLRAVALHFAGGLTADDPTSYNVATRIKALIEKSDLFRSEAADARGSDKSTAAGASTAGITPGKPAKTSGGKPAGDGAMTLDKMKSILTGPAE